MFFESASLAINSFESSCPVYLIIVTCSVAMQKHKELRQHA